MGMSPGNGTRWGICSARKPFRSATMPAYFVSLMRFFFSPGSSRTLYRSRWSLGEEEQRMTGAEHRMTGADHRMTGADHRMTGADHRMTGADHRMTGADNRMIGTDNRRIGTDNRQ